MKTCRDIAFEIEKLREKLRRNKTITEACDSPSPQTICIQCNCWKLNYENAVESQKKV